jgi:RHS repeat-associated protein
MRNCGRRLSGCLQSHRSNQDGCGWPRPEGELRSGAGSYTYDANGNTLSDASGKSYTWDFENRLTQAVVPGTNGGTTTFRYDPFGRRIQKSGPLGITNYLYDGISSKANVIEEVDNSGNLLARYAQTNMVDQPLAEVRGANTSYYEADVLGSVTSLSNPTASLTNSYIYDGFGNLTTSTGTLINPFQFTGRDSDPETSLDYYRARYYSPQMGRFLSEDPIHFGGGTNFFVYARNNPIRFSDPSGLITIDPSCNCSNTKQITWATPLAIAAASRIADPGLRDCVINKLNNGVVMCGGKDCDKHATPDKQGRIEYGNAPPWGSTIHLCGPAFSSDIATPCLLIHEFTHTCHHGEGVANAAENQAFPTSNCP